MFLTCSNPVPKPVFLTYYVPGNFHAMAYLYEVSKAAKKYEDKVAFMV